MRQNRRTSKNLARQTNRGALRNRPLPENRSWQLSGSPQRHHWYTSGWLLLLAGLLLFVGLITAVIATGLHSSTSSADHSLPTQSPAFSLTAQAGTPTSVPQVNTGIFSLANGGPIPVPANVFKPVNIARTVLNSEIYSIYAGSMARQPDVGALVVLQENNQSGQQSVHLYQFPHHKGALKIVNLQQNIVTFTTRQGQGSFNLLTDQFLNA
jgi:hypothetical protein